MKKKALLSVFLAVLASLLLIGCAKTSSSDPTNSGSNSGSNSSLSQVNTLLVGTLKLDGTAQAVTKEQAASLLTLWQAYQSLSSSQTAAQAEVDGLLKHIESSMTAEQMQAITVMDLTTDDMLTLLQAQGGPGLQGTPNPQGTPGANFPNGMVTGANPPDGMQPPSGSSGSNRPNISGGGQGPGGGGIVFQGGPGMGGDAGGSVSGQVLQGTPDPSMQATAQARFTTQASQVNVMLLRVLILKLEAMTAG